MGINGLLPLLKSIQKPSHIRQWKGQTVAVDAYGWLHRGTITCAIDLALGKHTRKYVDYAMHRVRMLQHFGVKPYIVFDGDYLPSKGGTEVEREAKRKSAREAGLELLRLGRTSQAHLELQKAIDVTPAMAGHLIEELRKAHVDFVVAPYEADAQMAYLEKTGEVSAIVSEDSDLLVFGAKCLITKMDQFGECVAINRTDFPNVVDLSFAGWSDPEFRMMAVLSGCDYLPSLPKMGIKTAYKYVRRYKTIPKLFKALRMSGTFTIPAGYEKSFELADLTFQLQRVYDKRLSCLVCCNGDLELTSQFQLENEHLFGKSYASDIATKVALGILDPITKIAFSPILRTHIMPQKSSIKDFFVRPALTELPISQVNNSNPPKVNRPVKLDLQTTKASKNNRPAKRVLNCADTNVSHDAQGSKKSRLCSDDGTMKLACTQQSRFFSAPPNRPAISASAKENSLGSQNHAFKKMVRLPFKQTNLAPTKPQPVSTSGRLNLQSFAFQFSR